MGRTAERDIPYFDTKSLFETAVAGTMGKTCLRGRGGWRRKSRGIMGGSYFGRCWGILDRRFVALFGTFLLGLFPSFSRESFAVSGRRGESHRRHLSPPICWYEEVGTVL
jgi:hypothetical protein